MCSSFYHISDSVLTVDDDEDFTMAASLPKKRKIENGMQNILTSHVTSALGRNKISDRQAVRLIIPIAAALGHDVSTLSLSRSTIGRVRKTARKEFAVESKLTYEPSSMLVVHWDGKIFPDTSGIQMR